MANSDQLLEWALRSVKNGDDETAKEILDELLKKDPNNHRALHLFSQVSGDNSEAIEVLNKILEIKPDDRFASRRLAALQDKLPDNKILPDSSQHEDDYQTIIVLAVILLVVVFFSVVAKLYGQYQNAEIAAVTASADTIRSLTMAASPSRTSRPAPTKRQAPADTEGGYRDKVAVLASRQAEYMKTFALQNGEVANNLSLLNSQDWNSRIAVTIIHLVDTAKAMANIEPVPVSLQGVDELLEQSYVKW